MYGVRSPVGTRKGFFFCDICPRLVIGSETHSACYSRVRILSPGINPPGLEAEHSPPSDAEVKKSWSIVSLPNEFSWCGT